MIDQDVQHLKKKLEDELSLIESELSNIGIKNPSNKNDWEAVFTEEDGSDADRNDTADEIEKFEGNTAILKRLETRYNNIKLALKKIDQGKYGICEVGNEPIEKERLEANPSARTCINHKEVHLE